MLRAGIAAVNRYAVIKVGLVITPPVFLVTLAALALWLPLLGAQ